MTKVDEALAEVKAELANIAPIHEGLRDYSRLNIDQSTEEAVQSAINLYDARVEVLTIAQEAMEALLSHGYPELELDPVDAAVFADLVNNQTTITAALGKFVRNEATTLDLTIGTLEEQP